MKNIHVRRQELKYYVNAAEADKMRDLFSKVLCKDKSPKYNNGYLVSSLYFESYDDRNLDEKLDGILSRRKYRIRIYNKDYALIKLENKIKENNTISKISSVITKEDSHNLYNLNFKNIKNRSEALNGIISYLDVFKYKAKVIVEYEREAYFLPYNNIRVTFDKNLSTYNNFTDFNNIDRGVSVPVINERMITLEVKFSNELPVFLKDILATIAASRASIGKYVLGQRFMNYRDSRDPLTNIF